MDLWSKNKNTLEALFLSWRMRPCLIECHFVLAKECNRLGNIHTCMIQKQAMPNAVCHESVPAVSSQTSVCQRYRELT